MATGERWLGGNSPIVPAIESAAPRTPTMSHFYHTTREVITLPLAYRRAELQVELTITLARDSDLGEAETDTGFDPAPGPREMATDTRPVIWGAGTRPEGRIDWETRRGEPVPELYLPAEEKAKNQEGDE